MSRNIPKNKEDLEHDSSPNGCSDSCPACEAEAGKVKFLESVEQSKFILEVYECNCGFHFGLDSTYLEQVGSINLNCPSCEMNINIEGDE